MSKVNVLHIHTLPVISGSGLNVLLTLKGLDKGKYRVCFACAGGGQLIDKMKQANLEFYPINHFVQRVSPYNDIIALLELYSLMRRMKVDIVHTHNSKAGFIGRLAAKLAGVPAVVHTVHGFAFHIYEKPFWRFLFIHLERFAAKFCDKIIFISEPLKKWAAALKIGDLKQYEKIFSGIEVERFRQAVDTHSVRQELKIGEDEKIVGVVAKLWPGKGHIDILQAAVTVVKNIPEVKFIIIGAGNLKSELIKRASELDISDKVIFTGFREDVPRLTAIFDVAVLASYFEGLGRVVLEAMAAGKPVVATRVGGIPEIVEENKQGLLVSPGAPAELSEALITLLKDEDTRRKMGAAARQKIDDKFSVKQMVTKIEYLYSELIKSKIKSNDG